jgi:hypothetical protein
MKKQQEENESNRCPLAYGKEKKEKREHQNAAERRMQKKVPK